MNLEQQISETLGLVEVLSDSGNSEWYHEEAANDDFYEYLHDMSTFYGTSERSIRIRKVHDLIKKNLSYALISSSSYVRTLAFLISKEDDKEWLEESYKIYFQDSQTKMLLKEKVLSPDQIKILVRN